MMPPIFATWLALYTAFFAAFVVTPGGRSLLVVTLLAGAFLGFLGAAIVSVPSAQQDWGHAVATAWVAMMAAGAAAGLVARSTTLVKGWPRHRSSGLATILLAFAAAPICLAGTEGYDHWRRRPPSAECIARSSFDVAIGGRRLSVPNWPLVMVSEGREHFVLSIPSSLRQLCERASAGTVMPADGITFFFGDITDRPSWPSLQAWLGRICPDVAVEVMTRLVCGDRPIDQLSIVSETGTAKRTGVAARLPSPAPLAEGRVGDRSGPVEGRGYAKSIEYPDRTWAFEDGTTVQCHPSANKGLACFGNIGLADDVAAKLTFTVMGGDVEAAWDRVRGTTWEFYAEIQKT
ncbi:hypothetical protein [Methylobacterium sp. J-077]|uniref:hypothetical protein n=1 Tax=Methylobacterium sp. J-077 TaxID=2836656 RepID=UPI001FBB6523|nr:hypothetical protein [Methylobacterium sp. J-077]MCJ2121795.1 hypothetical protein [Methylobacterium sp. J-077]